MYDSDGDGVDESYAVYRAQYDFSEADIPKEFGKSPEGFGTDILFVIGMPEIEYRRGGSGTHWKGRLITIQPIIVDKWGSSTISLIAHNLMWKAIVEIERIVETYFYGSARDIQRTSLRYERLGSTIIYGPIIEILYKEYELGTEQIIRWTHIRIGYDATHYTDIDKGIENFEGFRVHDGKPQFVANTKTSPDVFQPHSNYAWTIELMGDRRAAFFAQDVQVAAGSQYAMDENGDSNKIEYFKVVAEIQAADGTLKTRTFTVTNGYAFTNEWRRTEGGYLFIYRGIAEEIPYSDV